MNTKQVIVMRTQYPDGDKTTGLRKGKMISQGGHASMAFLTRRIQECNDGTRTIEQFQKYGDFDLWGYLNLTPQMQDWINGSFAKVCVKVNSEEELMEIHDKAKEAGLEVHLITDSGRTEFGGVPTRTCLAIGPDEAEKIDNITGELTLL